jgi:hypothetical protein
MIAVPEGMHIVTGAGSDITQRSGETRFLAHEILGSGELHVLNIAFKGRDRQSRPFGDRGVIGEIAAALRRRATMRLQDSLEVK